MKRIILLLITITTFTNVSYASFPVVEKVSFQTTEQIEPILESITYNRSKILRTKKSNFYFWNWKSNFYFWNWKVFTDWSTYSFKKKALICLIVIAASFGLAQLALIYIGPFFVTLLYNSTMN